MSTQRRRKRNTHPLLGGAAVKAARRALEDLGEGDVGRHLGAKVEGKNSAVHRFSARVPGYRGWEWNVVVACAAGSRTVTISEAALVPAAQALRAPEWVPYEDRIRPGDLGPGDLMPPAKDDPRITSDGQLSATGLAEAQQRWRTGPYGPTSEFAKKARYSCRTCAFFLPAGEQIGAHLGVCANVYSADGRVVHDKYGCGAHSRTPALPALGEPVAQPFDDDQPLRF